MEEVSNLDTFVHWFCGGRVRHSGQYMMNAQRIAANACAGVEARKGRSCVRVWVVCCVVLAYLEALVGLFDALWLDVVVPREVVQRLFPDVVNIKLCMRHMSSLD